MEYIKDLIRYIDENIDTIPMFVHKLEVYCSVSMHKLRKDFKAHESVILVKYLEKKKMDEHGNLKLNIPKFQLWS